MLSKLGCLSKIFDRHLTCQSFSSSRKLAFKNYDFRAEIRKFGIVEVSLSDRKWEFKTWESLHEASSNLHWPDSDPLCWKSFWKTVGDEMGCQQLCDIGNGFGRFHQQHPLSFNISAGYQHPKDVTNIKIPSPTPKNCHQHICSQNLLSCLDLKVQDFWRFKFYNSAFISSQIAFVRFRRLRHRLFCIKFLELRGARKKLIKLIKTI